MKAKSQITDTVIANALVAILERLDDVEKALIVLARHRAPDLFTDAVTQEKLDRLTLKRHAVLTATMAGRTYKDIATAMCCDQTTVKLQLKASLDILGIKNRNDLKVSHSQLLDDIPDAEYLRRYGISKRWWLEENAELMAVLRATKATHNQFTKP